MSESLKSISPQATPGFSADARGPEKQVSARDNLGIRFARTHAGAASDFADSLTLSPEAQSRLRELQQRDAEVRSHEQAHLAAGGPHVSGGANYTYQKGPDGRQYAIGGQVSIDVSAVPGDPDATREKARQARRAALAPGEPSGQDRQVAAKAATLEAKAAQEEQHVSLEEKRGLGASAEAAVSSMAAPGHRQETDADRAPDISPARADVPDRAASRAAEAYAAMRMRGTMPTALAPNGTGISLEI